MARPRQLIVRRPTNLTIDPGVRQQADAIALTRNMSLSQMVEGLLRKEIAQPHISTNAEEESGFITAYTKLLSSNEQTENKWVALAFLSDRILSRIKSLIREQRYNGAIVTAFSAWRVFPPDGQERTEAIKSLWPIGDIIVTQENYPSLYDLGRLVYASAPRENKDEERLARLMLAVGKFALADKKPVVAFDAGSTAYDLQIGNKIDRTEAVHMILTSIAQSRTEEHPKIADELISRAYQIFLARSLECTLLHHSQKAAQLAKRLGGHSALRRYSELADLLAPIIPNTAQVASDSCTTDPRSEIGVGLRI